MQPTDVHEQIAREILDLLRQINASRQWRKAEYILIRVTYAYKQDGTGETDFQLLAFPIKPSYKRAEAIGFADVPFLVVMSNKNTEFQNLQILTNVMTATEHTTVPPPGFIFRNNGFGRRSRTEPHSRHGQPPIFPPNGRFSDN